MAFKCGIVGLPNVGKSTLFNALTATQAAQAANYPFCTIEPNVGNVAVPDARLDTLAKIVGSAKTVYALQEFVDIAGLVKGASKGEGLGNQFLANIRQTDAIIHVLRCFEDENVTHVEGSVDPIRDAEIIETELMLADLDSVEKQLDNAAKKAKGGDKDAKLLHGILIKAQQALAAGQPARTVALADDEQKPFRMLQLMTAKPVLFICNVAEGEAAGSNAWSEKAAAMAKAQNAESVVISAAIEAEIAQLPTREEKQEFLETLGLTEPGLDKIIRAGHRLLGLQTYFTVGPKEARAWTVRAGAKAPEAAGVIHGDFERGFIRAETISYDDFVRCGSEAAAKDQGKMRQEGKDYAVQDGDVMNFRFNV